MKANSVKSKNIKSIPNDVFINAISEYIDKTNFPKKIELKRIQVTNKFLNERIERMDSAISEGKDKLTRIEKNNQKLKKECTKLLKNLSDLV